VFEIGAFTGDVDAGEWTDRDKINYVTTYAAKLRFEFPAVASNFSFQRGQADEGNQRESEQRRVHTSRHRDSWMRGTSLLPVRILMRASVPLPVLSGEEP